MRNAMILFVTNACNARCRHCFISPLTELGNMVMDYDVFTKAIEFSEYRRIDRIVLSGGEAFLYWDVISEYLKKRTVNDDVRFTLCTNGYWGYNASDRERVLKELLTFNFDTLEISTDTFHQEYVDVEKSIIPLVKDAISYGFRVDITVCYEDIICEATTIGLIKKISADEVHLHIRPLSGFGRARDNAIFTNKTYGVEQLCSVAGEICVRYDGNCYICCGPPIVYDLKEFCFGNVLVDSPNVLDAACEKNRPLNIMKKGIFECMEGGCMKKDGENSLCHRCICYSADRYDGSCDKKGVLA